MDDPIACLCPSAPIADADDSVAIDRLERLRGPYARCDLQGIWRSPLLHTLRTRAPGRCSGQAWVRFIDGLRQHGVGQDEIQAGGLMSWLAATDRRVTRAELIEFIEEQGLGVRVMQADGWYRRLSMGGGNNYRAILFVATGHNATFERSHFAVPNVFAHIRLVDRTLAGDRKFLHIEEVQSDWHRSDRSGPFRKNWVRMAITWCLQEALERGLDGVSLSHGPVQADRYPKLASTNGLQRFYREVQRQLEREAIRIGGTPTNVTIQPAKPRRPSRPRQQCSFAINKRSGPTSPLFRPEPAPATRRAGRPPPSYQCPAVLLYPTCEAARNWRRPFNRMCDDD